MADIITAAVTTYKREPDMVCRAIKSILAQTYSNVEIILVDDSPEDYPMRENVREAVHKLDPGIRIIQHKINLGACAARNTALEHANGKYIAFLDDDDEWLPEKLEKQIAGFTSENIALVYCGRYQNNSETMELYLENTEFYSGYIYEALIWHNFIGSTSFPLIRTDYLRSVNGFDRIMRSAQDYDVWLRLSRKYEITYIDAPLAIYHVHDGEQITKNPKAKIHGLEEINKRNDDIISSNNKLWVQRHSVLVPYYIMDGQINKAFILWMKCVCKCPFSIKKNTKILLKMISDIWRTYK